MHMFMIVMKVFLALVATASIAHTIYAERRNLKFAVTIWSRFRLLMFLEVLAVIILTLSTYKFLVWCVPALNYGWMNLFVEGGGNLFLAPVSEATHAESGWVRILPNLFFLLLLLALPFMARIEEKIFRKDAYRWADITKRSIAFGLVHLVVGVPVAAGIALIVPGLFYAIVYRRTFLKELLTSGRIYLAHQEALLASTTYHTLYNTVLIVGLIVGNVLLFFV